MTELTVVLKAREFVDVVNPTTIPVDVTAYVNKLKAVIRLENDLGKDESGWSFEHCGKYYICVNAKDQKERQRFTVCHEIAHIVLGLSFRSQYIAIVELCQKIAGGDILRYICCRTSSTL